MGEQGKKKKNLPEHTAGGSEGKGTEKLQRRTGHPRWRKEAGGGERGKLSPREATRSHPANRPQFPSKDFLRPYPARAGAAEGKGAQHPRRVCPSLWRPEPLRPGKTQHEGTTDSALLWRT